MKDPILINKIFIEVLHKNLTQNKLYFLGIADLKKVDQNSFIVFSDWLNSNNHGEMSYLENHLTIRKEPKLLLDNANYSILIALPYFNNKNNIPTKMEDKPLQVARYSVFKDYHKLIKKFAENAINETLIQLNIVEDNSNFRVVTDSAPILERALFSQFGKGFIGKNTMYIDPKKGSFFLLGEIFIQGTLEYPVSNKPAQNRSLNRSLEKGGCGTCRRCQVNCPTDALSKAYVLDARKCLAYLSIEYRGVIPFKYWRHFGDYLFGCDICQIVCPYNRETKKSLNSFLNKMELKNLPGLLTIATLTQNQYQDYFGGTPLTRTKIFGLQRNALLAMFARSDINLSKALLHKDLTQNIITRKTALKIIFWRSKSL